MTPEEFRAKVREFVYAPEDMSEEELLEGLEKKRGAALKHTTSWEEECQKAAQRYEESKARVERSLAMETEMVALLKEILKELKTSNADKSPFDRWISR